MVPVQLALVDQHTLELRRDAERHRAVPRSAGARHRRSAPRSAVSGLVPWLRAGSSRAVSAARPVPLDQVCCA